MVATAPVALSGRDFFGVYGLSLLLAAQIGPVTLLIVRSVARGRRALLIGLAMAAAVAGIDVLYATIGLAGAGQLLAADGLRVVLGAISAAILIVLGCRTVWLGIRARAGLELREDTEPRRAFLTATAATALNPLTIALWTISFPAAVPGAATASAGGAGTTLAAVALGALTWYCGFAAVIALLRRRLTARMLAVLDLGIGAALIAFGGLLAYRTADD